MNKKQILIFIIVIAVAITLLFSVIVPQYKRNRLTDPKTIADAKKLALDKTGDQSLVDAIGAMPSCINKMSNREVNWVYKYFFTYLKYKKSIPDGELQYAKNALAKCIIQNVAVS